MPLLPEDVGAGQGRVAAEVHLDGRREPAEPEAVPLAMQEGRLRQVHLPRHVLHPALVARAGKTQTAAGLPAKGRSVKASTWTIFSPMAVAPSIVRSSRFPVCRPRAERPVEPDARSQLSQGMTARRSRLGGVGWSPSRRSASGMTRSVGAQPQRRGGRLGRHVLIVELAGDEWQISEGSDLGASAPGSARPPAQRLRTLAGTSARLIVPWWMPLRRTM